HAVDPARGPLQRGGVRVRDLYRERVRRVGNGELQSRAPSNLFGRNRADLGAAVDQRRGVSGYRDPAMQSQHGATAERIARGIAVVAIGEEPSDGHQPQPADGSRCGQLGVGAGSRLVITGLERYPRAPVAGKRLPFVRKRFVANVGRRRVVEADQEWERKLVAEKKRWRIRDHSEWGRAHSESVHEVELQRAARAQPATRQVGGPIEHGLARGYISDSSKNG